MRRRLFTIALALGMTSALSLALSPVAAAATIEKSGTVRDSGCAGSRIDSWPVISELGKRTGTVELWYSSRNGGENCAITRSSVGRADMFVQLVLDMDGNKRYSSGDRTSLDHGVYDSYAGGAYRTNANGRCVWIQGGLTKGGVAGSADAGYFGHCG